MSRFSDKPHVLNQHAGLSCRRCRETQLAQNGVSSDAILVAAGDAIGDDQANCGHAVLATPGTRIPAGDFRRRPVLMPAAKVRTKQLSDLPVANGRNNDLQAFVEIGLAVPLQPEIGRPLPIDLKLTRKAFDGPVIPMRGELALVRCPGKHLPL